MACQSRCLSSRMYTVILCPDRQHPLTIVYKASSVFPFHVSPVLFYFIFLFSFFFNGLSPTFVFTSVISHLFEPQRLEMVMVDATDRWFPPLVCGTPLHKSNRLKHIHPQCEHSANYKEWFLDKLNTNTQTHTSSDAQ